MLEGVVLALVGVDRASLSTAAAELISTAAAEELSTTGRED